MTNASSVEMTTATLICLPPAQGDEGSKGEQVIGIELPGSSPLMQTGMAFRPGYPTNVELKWPEPMIGELVEVFDETYVKQTVDKWNCHTFGARVTGRADRLQLSKWLEVTNSTRGPAVTPEEMANGGLYGLYERLGYLIHTLVGTQVSGKCLNVCGSRRPLYYSSVHQLQGTYGKRLHPYLYNHRYSDRRPTRV